MIEIPSNISQEYVPVPSNLSEFMADTGSNRGAAEEPMPEDIPDQPDGTSGEDINWPETPSDERPGRGRMARVGGRALARVIDNGYACLAAVIAHDKMETFKSTKSEQDEVEEVLNDYLADTDLEISPGVALIISLVGIYAFRFKEVLEVRNKNLKLEAQQRAAAKTVEFARKNKDKVEDVRPDTETADNTDQSTK